MTTRRKDAIRAYKERPIRRGIFAVRCTASGAVWVDAAPNLDSVQNRHWFMLRHGQHRNAALQAAWNAHGEHALQMETLEELDDDIPTLLVQDLLTKRKQDWMRQLQAATVS